MFYKILHTRGYTVTLINANTEAGKCKCGIAIFAANLNYPSLSLYDGDSFVGKIVIPDEAMSKPVVTSFTSPEDDLELELIA